MTASSTAPLSGSLSRHRDDASRAGAKVRLWPHSRAQPGAAKRRPSWAPRGEPTAATGPALLAPALARRARSSYSQHAVRLGHVPQVVLQLLGVFEVAEDGIDLHGRHRLHERGRHQVELLRITDAAVAASFEESHEARAHLVEHLALLIGRRWAPGPLSGEAHRGDRLQLLRLCRRRGARESALRRPVAQLAVEGLREVAIPNVADELGEVAADLGAARGDGSSRWCRRRRPGRSGSSR
mmetsp:Transcript_16854/g.52844  ORF Transcript_16854/g.52844 Transcript_16854/m.52844 type:complete len:240 (-) Transcript_16854:49-768(-)